MAAHAAAVPLIVEQLDPGIGAVRRDRVVAGAYDASFKSQSYAAVIPSREHGVWYRIRLRRTGRIRGRRRSRSSIRSGLHVELYVPPAYVAQPRASTRRRRSRLHASRDRADPAADVAGDGGDLPARRARARDAAPRRGQRRVDYRAGDLARARLDVLFPAIQLATLLVMFAFFLALRERIYAYFVGYVLCLVLYELYVFGIGYELPPMDFLAPLDQRPAWCAALPAVALHLSFSRLFLDLRAARRASTGCSRASLALRSRWPFARSHRSFRAAGGSRMRCRCCSC